MDDDAGITRLIATAAQRLAFNVLKIHDSDQFEAAFAAVKPTVIFLDITMPGRDGMELMASPALQSYLGKLVIMSGSDQRYIHMGSTIAVARGLVVAGTLSKRFRMHAVTDLLRRLLMPPD